MGARNELQGMINFLASLLVWVHCFFGLLRCKGKYRTRGNGAWRRKSRQSLSKIESLQFPHLNILKVCVERKTSVLIESFKIKVLFKNFLIYLNLYLQNKNLAHFILNIKCIYVLNFFSKMKSDFRNHIFQKWKYSLFSYN